MAVMVAMWLLAAPTGCRRAPAPDAPAEELWLAATEAEQRLGLDLAALDGMRALPRQSAGRLATALEGRRAATRMRALEGLRRLGAAGGPPPEALEEALEDRAPTVRLAAARAWLALGGEGADATRTLSALLASEDATAWEEAVAAIGEGGLVAASAPELLVPLLRSADDSRLRRLEAALVACDLAAVAPMTRLLADSGARQVDAGAARRVLGGIVSGDPSIAAALAARAELSAPRELVHVLQELARRGEEVVPLQARLAPLASSPHPDVGTAARRALGATGAQATEATRALLAERLEADVPAACAAAAEALGAIAASGGDVPAASLARAAAAPDEEVAIAAAGALAELFQRNPEAATEAAAALAAEPAASAMGAGGAFVATASAARGARAAFGGRSDRIGWLLHLRAEGGDAAGSPPEDAASWALAEELALRRMAAAATPGRDEVLVPLLAGVVARDDLHAPADALLLAWAALAPEAASAHFLARWTSRDDFEPATPPMMVARRPASLGERAVEVLAAAADDEAARLLPALRGAARVPLASLDGRLRALSADPDSGEAGGLAAALRLRAGRGDARDVARMRAALAASPPPRPATLAAICAALHAEPAAARAALGEAVAALDHVEPGTRPLLLAAIGGAGGLPAWCDTAPLRRALGARDRWTRLFAGVALARLGESGTSFLVTVMGDERALVREAAARGAGSARSAPPALLLRLVALAGDADTRVAATARVALARLGRGDAAVHGALAARLLSPHLDEAFDAAGGVARLGDAAREDDEVALALAHLDASPHLARRAVAASARRPDDPAVRAALADLLPALLDATAPDQVVAACRLLARDPGGAAALRPELEPLLRRARWSTSDWAAGWAVVALAAVGAPLDDDERAMLDLAALHPDDGLRDAAEAARAAARPAPEPR